MIGIDLVQLRELSTQIENGGDIFLSKAFHPDEMKRDDIAHLAGLWAAKEAVMKASGIAAGRWLDITIHTHANGGRSASVDGMEFEVSISHHGDYAVAVAYSAPIPTTKELPA